VWEKKAIALIKKKKKKNKKKKKKNRVFPFYDKGWFVLIMTRVRIKCIVINPHTNLLDFSRL